MKISMIVAVDNRMGIGKNNDLPWHLPADLKHFKSLTIGHCMIMGRKTYESIGKPLPGRISIVITRQKDYEVQGVHICHDLRSGFLKAAELGEINTFVIGGSEIFKLALEVTTNLYLTRISGDFECDTFFPEIDLKQWILLDTDEHEPDAKNLYSYTFEHYEKLVLL